MLDKVKKDLIDKIVAGFSKEEIIWSAGYLSGVAVGGGSLAGQEAKIDAKISIIYVSETGNSKFLAGKIAASLKAKGAQVKLKASEQYRLSDLKKEKNLLLISSTHGEGEVPEQGKELFEFIKNEDLNLSALSYFVIGLGDTNYPLFCQAGKDFDKILSDKKAKSLGQPVELDLDFENHIEDLSNKVASLFSGQDFAATPVGESKKSTKNEYEGEIVQNVDLNDNGSSKETRHIEIVSDDEIDYEPGDAVGLLISGEDLGFDKEEKVTPRLYSIASAKSEHGNEIHLTVSVVRYLNDKGEEVEGLFSSHLSRLKEGQKIKFYISKNRNFKLPQGDKDVIMIGPGTGVAPFRSFLAHRNSEMSEGKNWLFFGERNFHSDFLYQTELQDHLASGVLNKLDVAFSRDQEQKVYVQDRIRENSAEFFNWIESGAYIYICGDKNQMAKDVEKSLLEVIKSRGGKDHDEAEKYLQDLKGQGRYLLDVY